MRMFVAATQSQELEEKYKFRRSAIGTLALAIMGCFYAWHFSRPSQPLPTVPEQTSPTPVSRPS